jgi:glyoxylase-like metal-dependent hydrolase (beta-lactamase superfamily II)
MRLNRDFRKNRNNPITGMILKMPVARLGKANRFKPDIYLEDNQDLSEYGLDGKVIHIPGHSMGSIGVLTGERDIFCGDLMLGGKKPKKNSLVDSAADMDASIQRLKELDVRTVYPGHGKPFKMTDLV